MNAQGTIVDRCLNDIFETKKKTLAKNLSANLISQRFGTYAVAAPNQVNSRRKQHFQKVLPLRITSAPKSINDDPSANAISNFSAP